MGQYCSIMDKIKQSCTLKTRHKQNWEIWFILSAANGNNIELSGDWRWKTTVEWWSKLNSVILWKQYSMKQSSAIFSAVNGSNIELYGDWHWNNRGSYMNAHALLNLLNELGKKIRCEAMPSILSVFANEFWHQNRILLANSASIHRSFAIRKRDVFMDVTYNVTTPFPSLIN